MGSRLGGGGGGVQVVCMQVQIYVYIYNLNDAMHPCHTPCLFLIVCNM